MTTEDALGALVAAALVAVILSTVIHRYLAARRAQRNARRRSRWPVRYPIVQDSRREALSHQDWSDVDRRLEASLTDALIEREEAARHVG